MSPAVAHADGPIAGADRFFACALAACVLAVYTLCFQGFPALPDAEIEFQSASALVRTGSFALGGTPESDALVAHARTAAIGSFAVVPGKDGKCYAWYGPVQAWVAVPFFAVGRVAAKVWPDIEARTGQVQHMGVLRSEGLSHAFVGWRNPFLGALTAALVFTIARRLSASRKVALFAGAGYAFTTFAWPQACATLDDVQATFFVALAVDAVLALRLAEHGRGTALRLGLALSMAVLTRVNLLPLALVLLAAGFFARRGKDDRRAVVITASGCLALALAWLAWFDFARFGNAFDTGYAAAVRGGLFSGSPLESLVGLLVSPGRGLVWFAPALLIGIVGARSLKRHGDAGFVALVLASAIAVYLPLAFLRAWHGAWTFGPRYVLPFLPIAFPLVAIALERGSARVRVATYALFAIGLVAQVPGVLVDTATYHDLALQAARAEWPDTELASRDEREREEARFERTLWSPAFQPSLAHARILAARLSAPDTRIGEEALSTRLFGLDPAAPIAVSHEREERFLHMAWVDLHERAGAPLWPAALVSGLLLLLTILFAWAGRRTADPDEHGDGEGGGADPQGIGSSFR